MRHPTPSVRNTAPADNKKIPDRFPPGNLSLYAVAMSGAGKFITKHKRSIAITASLSMHVFLFCVLAISSASTLADKTLKGDGQAEVEGIELDLVGLHDSAEAMAQAYQPPAPQTPRMSSFMQMADTDSPPPDWAIKASMPVAKPLSEALGENPFQPQPQSPAQTAAAKTSTEAHVKVSDRSNPTPNDLWKAIAPCWNRIADKNTLPVTLEVSFSPMGNLAKPPVIRRDQSKRITDQMLRSESQAITALAQCGPYLMIFGQENVQVAFPKKG